MRADKKAALKVLSTAAEVYNCWAILDDALGDDELAHSHDFIEGEREMLAHEIRKASKALRKLGELCDTEEV